MDVFTLTEKPLLRQIEAIEKGLPSTTLAQIAKLLGLPKLAIIRGLRLTQRTVTARERAGREFPLDESERLFRVVRVRNTAREVFSSDEAVAEWLNAPDRSLAGKTPLEMLATDIGARKVDNLLMAMVHGVPL